MSALFKKKQGSLTVVGYQNKEGEIKELLVAKEATFGNKFIKASHHKHAKKTRSYLYKFDENKKDLELIIAEADTIEANGLLQGKSDLFVVIQNGINYLCKYDPKTKQLNLIFSTKERINCKAGLLMGESDFFETSISRIDNLSIPIIEAKHLYRYDRKTNSIVKLSDWKNWNDEEVWSVISNGILLGQSHFFNVQKRDKQGNTKNYLYQYDPDANTAKVMLKDGKPLTSNNIFQYLTMSEAEQEGNFLLFVDRNFKKLNLYMYDFLTDEIVEILPNAKDARTWDKKNCLKIRNIDDKSFLFFIYCDSETINSEKILDERLYHYNRKTKTLTKLFDTSTFQEIYTIENIDEFMSRETNFIVCRGKKQYGTSFYDLYRYDEEKNKIFKLLNNVSQITTTDNLILIENKEYELYKFYQETNTFRKLLKTDIIYRKGLLRKESNFVLAQNINKETYYRYDNTVSIYKYDELSDKLISVLNFTGYYCSDTNIFSSYPYITLKEKIDNFYNKVYIEHLLAGKSYFIIYQNSDNPSENLYKIADLHGKYYTKLITDEKNKKAITVICNNEELGNAYLQIEQYKKSEEHIFQIFYVDLNQEKFLSYFATKKHNQKWDNMIEIVADFLIRDNYFDKVNYLQKRYKIKPKIVSCLNNKYNLKSYHALYRLNKNELYLYKDKQNKYHMLSGKELAVVDIIKSKEIFDQLDQNETFKPQKKFRIKNF